MQVIYPKTNPDKDLRIKLEPDDIIEIRNLYKKGFSKPQIAEMKDVSYSCVRYHLMSEKERKNFSNLRCEWHAKKMKEDTDYKKKHAKGAAKSLKRKRKIMPEEVKEYCRLYKSVLSEEVRKKYKDTFNKKRREKYANDEEYRNKCIDYSKKHREKKLKK